MIRIWLTVLVLFSLLNMHASHILGGEISYKLIDSIIGRYKFKVTLYRDCRETNFSNEVLIVNKVLSRDTFPLTFISKKEITNLCEGPDVSTPILTKCSSNNPNTILPGVEAWVYEAEVNVGKNIGWFHAYYAQCCRSPLINTCLNIGNEVFLISAIINSNYQNNSIVGTAYPIPQWSKLQVNTYNMEAVDSFDAKFISINGQMVVRDSIAYQLYTPYNGINQDPNGVTPFTSVSFVPALNPYNFIFTTTGIQFNPVTGDIRAIPDREQLAVLAMAVKEFRTVPNTNGIGYRRELVSIVNRDVHINIGNILPRIQSNTLANDTISFEVKNSNSQVFRTCRRKDNVIKQQFIYPKTVQLKVKDKSIIDTNEVSNYSYTSYVKSGTLNDTLILRIKTDFKKTKYILDLKFEAYYCTSIGEKISSTIPITIEKDSFAISFQKDTLYSCHEDTLRLDLPLAENLRWTNQSQIIAAQNLDSNWISILPLTSQWIKAQSATLNSHCYVNDSIFIYVDSCKTITGNVFLDSIENCQFDTNESRLTNRNLFISNVYRASNYTLVLDSMGNYKVKLPINSSYKYKMEYLRFNCNSSQGEIIHFIRSNDTVIHLPIQDSVALSNLKYEISDSVICSGDTMVLILKFHKSFGNGLIEVNFGDGRLEKIGLNLEASSNYKFIWSHKYSKLGESDLSIRLIFPNKNQLLLYSKKMEIGRCIKGRVYFDANDNCQYQQGIDIPIYPKIVMLKNLNSNLVKSTISANGGFYKFVTDPRFQYLVYSNEITNCPDQENGINIDSGQVVKAEYNLPLNSKYINYRVTESRIGRIDLFRELEFQIGVAAIHKLDNAIYNYQINIPPKALLSSISGQIQYSINNRIISVSSLSGFKIRFKFDSLVHLDTLCFHIKLKRVFNEQDTLDNELIACIPAFTSYDPNMKIVSIASQEKNGNFTNKNHPLNYTIHFQNTGTMAARDVSILDTISPFLDITSLEFLSSSHSMIPSISENRLLRFDFKTIMLPDSHSNPIGSKGYVSYSIKPLSNFDNGQVIRNSAQIFFDFNPPILTNTTRNSFVYKLSDSSEKNSNLEEILNENVFCYPNPFQSKINFKLNKNSKQVNIILTDIEGRQLLRYNFNNISEITIDDILLSSGLYIFQIETDKERLFFKVKKE